MFAENIELLIFSTPVKRLGVSGQIVDINEEAGESDNPDPIRGHPQIWCFQEGWL